MVNFDDCWNDFLQDSFIQYDDSQPCMKPMTELTQSGPHWKIMDAHIPSLSLYIRFNLVNPLADKFDTLDALVYG